MALKDLLIARPVSTITPIVSSLAGALKTYFDNILPSGYLKDYYIDTDVPLAQLRRRAFKPLSESKLSVRRLPLMSMRVDLSSEPSEYNDPNTWYLGNAFIADPINLNPLLMDDISHRYIGFQHDRLVCRFQISFTAETDLKAREIAIFLRRALPQNYRAYLTSIVISSEVPPDILRKIWVDMALGDGSNVDDWEDFHQYLRAFTGGHVSKQIDTSTGRSAYFFDHVANPIMIFQGAPSVSATREGNVIRSSQVDLQIDLDIPVPMTYVYRQRAVIAPTEPPLPNIGLNPDGTAYFGLSVLTRPPRNIDETRMLCYFTSIVTPNLDKDFLAKRENDVTEFGSFIRSDLKEYIEAIPEDDREVALGVKLWADNKECNENTYTFDWSTYKLTILSDSLLYNHKYSIGLYVDLGNLRAFERYQRPQAPRPYY
jgi:hypothetical protein